MGNILEVKNLRKTFGDKTAVDGVSFAVKKRSFFAFLGQNGAGKTTTINMAIGLLRRDEGEVLYNGSPDFSAFKDKIGVVFQNNIFDELLTVEENLLCYGALYMPTRQKLKERFAEVVELLSLSDFLTQRVKTLSGGQKRKAEIARALFMSPEILFLDEPTTGLDPKTRAEIWGIVNKLKDENSLTIFLTTHYMEETAAADSIAIIDKGKLIASGSPAELKSRYTYDRLLITPKDADALESKLSSAALVWHRAADTYTVKIGSTAESIELLHRLRSNIRFYEVIKGSMDDVFLNVVGGRLGEGGVTL